MAIEVVCPRCGGRLPAEPGTPAAPADPGAPAACPHCEEPLTIPSAGEDDSVPGQSASAVFTAPPDAARSHTQEFPGLPVADTVSADSFLLAAAAAGGPAPGRSEPDSPPDPLPDAGRSSTPSCGRWDAPDEVQPRPADHTSPPPLSGCTPGSASEEAGTLDDALAAATFGDHDPAPPVVGPSTDRAEWSPGGDAGARGRRRRSGVPLAYFLAVCSYALLATLILVVLVALRLRPHQLESLPDIVPQRDAQGEIPIPLYPENAQLPPGHELRLGEVGRFGSLRVQPLRVTRGPVEFVHFQGDASQNNGFGREASRPVLKLWLHLRNVARDQTFAPLGAELVFARGRGKVDRRRRGNNFICPADPASRPAGCVYVFDHIISGEYDLKDQHVDRGLAPGEELTTYIPSEEDGLENLEQQCELVWRVHLRKGLAPSGWGVTTLVDVRFHSHEIIREGEVLATAAVPTQ